MKIHDCEDDYEAIVRVMRLYIDAFNDNDVSKFREAFDDDAWIYYIDAGGGFHKHPISEDFERWAAPPSWGGGGWSRHLGHPSWRCGGSPAWF